MPFVSLDMLIHSSDFDGMWLSSWKKLKLEWQETCTRGQQQLLKIANSVQRITYLNSHHWGSLSDCQQLHDRASSRLWELAHRCCIRLQQEVNELAKIYMQMRHLLKVDGNIMIDDKRRERYEMFLLEALSMYEHELAAKSLIAYDIFECSKHETVTVYLASWQMEPHIDMQRIEELEEIILIK